MIGAFIAITARTFKNRIVQRIRRLKQPRYAVGGVFAVLYFGWLLFRNRRAATLISQMGANQLRIDVISVIGLAILLFAWALPSDSGGLTFSEAEIAFLFPSPLRRRDLLLYKFIRSQPQILFSSLAFTILGLSRGRFVGIWLALSALSIYLTFVALGRARLKLLHIGFIARTIIVLFIAAVVVNVALMRNGVSFREHHTAGPAEIAALGHAFFQQPFIRAVLFVPRLFATAVFPTSMRELAISWAALLVLLIAFFIAAALLNVSFEEASIARSQRRNTMRERMRQQRAGGYVRFRRVGSPFRLAERGRPEVAIVWKNIIATVRLSGGTIIALSFVFLAIFGSRIFIRDAGPQFMSLLFLCLACIFPVIGPLLFANDFRLDLPRFEILKSYPLTGDLVVAAEIAAPLVVVSTFEIAALVCFLATTAVASHGPLKLVTATQVVVCALIAAVPFCGLQLLIRNAGTLLFPAWATRPKEDVRGFAVGGQRLLMLVGNFAVLSILLIPVAIVFVPCVMIANHYLEGTPIAYALMTVPAAAVMAGELWLGVKLLGSRFDQLDVSLDFDAVTTV